MGTFPDEPLNPPVWTTEAFDNLLRWCVEQGASDITLIPNSPAGHRVHGKWTRATTQPLLRQSIERYVEHVSQNPGAMALLTNGNYLDFSYDLLVGRGVRTRFRVNATACACDQGLGVNLTFRSIPSVPPKTTDLGLEPALLEDIFHSKGLVMIAGTMGSGKSTLLASVLRDVRENQPHRFIVTYEYPIEFDLRSIEGAEGLVTQTEIPTHLKSFEDAPINATRRAVDVLLVGESRELETFRGVCQGAEIGCAAYTTVHTQSVAETVRRVVSAFPSHEQNSVLTRLVGSLRMIVYQMLVPRADGEGRVALREWLSISQDFRRVIMGAPLNKLDELFNEEICRNGQPLVPYAEELFRQGIISEDTLLFAKREHAFKAPDSAPVFSAPAQRVLVADKPTADAIAQEYSRREGLPPDSLNAATLAAVMRDLAKEVAHVA